MLSRHYPSLLTSHRRASLICFLVAPLVVVAMWALGSSWVGSPAVPLLLDERGAEWIVAGEPFHLSCRRLGVHQATFRARFQVREALSSAVIELRAYRVAVVAIDGHIVSEPRTEYERWKEPISIPLSSPLAPGLHEIAVHVVNLNGPPALLAYLEAAGVATGPAWEASTDGVVWTPARLASEARSPTIALEFPPAYVALATRLPLFLGIFAAVVAASLWIRGRAEEPRVASVLRRAPGAAVWVLLLLWVLLAGNNVLRLPDHVGFDVWAHLDYIRYVAQHGRIPLPTEGWQMFQSPLYYLLSALLYNLLSSVFEPSTSERLLRVIPLLCGAAQVPIAYLASRAVFPKRPGLQVVATLVGGLLPMSLYVSQAVGNEPLAGCLSGVVIVLTLRLLVSEGSGASVRHLAVLGLVLGLALLAKATAVLLVPCVLGAVAWTCLRVRGPVPARVRITRAAAGCGTVFAIALMVSGWYYARNWIALGQPFVGGWDPSRLIVWWQDPGYRTTGDLLRFGTSLVRPILAAAAGIWDGLYSTLWADGYLSSVITFEHRPPWHYDLLLAGPLLGLLPSVGLLLGVSRVPARRWGRARSALVLCAALLAIHLVAVVSLFVALPVYSTAKASYLLGLTPVLAVLAAAGLDLLGRGRLGQALVQGGLACWAVGAYGAYFI